jgi:microcystin-dependent protein
MPLPISLRFQMGTLTPGQVRTQQQLADEIATRLSAYWDGALGFQNGGVEPTSDIGPWLKNGNEWRFWDPATGRYSLGVYFPGMIMGYGGSTIDPSKGWLMCDGQAYSRTLYPDLFAVIGSTFGAGDGSSTFNVPDRRGKTGIGAGIGTVQVPIVINTTANITNGSNSIVVASSAGFVIGLVIIGSGIPVNTTISNIAGTTITLSQNATANLTGSPVTVITTTLTSAALTNRVLGTSFGEETHQLTEQETWRHFHRLWGVNTNGVGTTNTGLARSDAALTGAIGSPNAYMATNTADQLSESVGGDQAHNNMQPSLVQNYIIKT